MARAACLGVFLVPKPPDRIVPATQRYVVCLAQSIGGASAKAARPTQGDVKRAMEQMEIPMLGTHARTQ